MRDLKAGRPAQIPQYDFVTSSRRPECTCVEAADVILFDGILAFYSAGAPSSLWSCEGTTQWPSQEIYRTTMHGKLLWWTAASVLTCNTQSQLFANAELRDLFDLMIFVDVDNDTRLARR
jgi:pantothenate kinase